MNLGDGNAEFFDADEYYKNKATRVAKEHIMEFKLMN